MTSPALNVLPADAHRALFVIDAQRAGAGDAGLAHAARDDRRMRGHAAAGRENALRRVHAVNVFGAGFDAHQNDLAAGMLELLGFIGTEDDLAAGGAGRGGKAVGDDLALGVRIERRMQQLIERAGIDARHRLVVGDQTFLRHLDRDAQSCLRRALAIAGLQHPEFAALDGELHVLHVAIMFFEQLA